MKQLKEDFFKWKWAFKGKGSKVNMSKTKIMKANGLNTLVHGVEVDPCGVCGKKMKQTNG